MLVALILFGLILLLYAAPDIPSVKPLRRVLVVKIALVMSRQTPAKVLFWLALGLAAALLVGLFEGEGLRIFTMMAPDMVLWFVMFDVATIADALLFGLIVSPSMKLEGLVGRVKATIRPWRDLALNTIHRVARARTPSPARQVARKPARTDDPDGWPGLTAYAG